MAELKAAKFVDFKQGIQSDTDDYANGVDFMSGVNFTKDPNVFRSNVRMSVMTEAAATDDITTLITQFAMYNEGAGAIMYGIGGQKIYGLSAFTSGTWTRLHTDGNSVSNGSIAVFGTNLYWSSNAKLGKYVGSTTTWTDSFKDLAVNDGSYHPLVNFAGKLMVGAGRYVATLDADGTTWDDTALTLPLNSRIFDMKVWNDRIAILVDVLTGKRVTKIYFWDGSSDTYNEEVTIDEPTPRALVDYFNHLMVFNRDGRIFEYDGASLNLVRSLPNVSPETGASLTVNPGGITIHNNDLLFGLTGTNSDFKDGVWAFSRLDVTHPIALNYHTPTSNRNQTDTIGAVFAASSGDLYLAWQSGAAYGVDVSNANNYLLSSWAAGPTHTPLSYIDTVHHSLGDRLQDVVIMGVEVHVAEKPAVVGLSTGLDSTVTIFTNPDKSGTYTEQDILYELNTWDKVHWFSTPVECRSMQLRLSLSNPVAGAGETNIRGYTIYYQERGPLFARE